MASPTLQDYEELLEIGFTEKQARVLARMVGANRTDPEVLHRLDGIEQKLDAQSQTLAEQTQTLAEQTQALVEQSRVLAQHTETLNQHSKLLEQHTQVLDRHSQSFERYAQMLGMMLPSVEKIPSIEREIKVLQGDVRDLSANQHVVEERVKMEGRVTRMINATLIALGAIAASLVAAFTR